MAAVLLSIIEASSSSPPPPLHELSACISGLSEEAYRAVTDVFLVMSDEEVANICSRQDTAKYHLLAELLHLLPTHSSSQAPLLGLKVATAVGKVHGGSMDTLPSRLQVAMQAIQSMEEDHKWRWSSPLAVELLFDVCMGGCSVPTHLDIFSPNLLSSLRRVRSVPRQSNCMLQACCTFLRRSMTMNIDDGENHGGPRKLSGLLQVGIVALSFVREEEEGNVNDICSLEMAILDLMVTHLSHEDLIPVTNQLASFISSASNHEGRPFIGSLSFLVVGILSSLCCAHPSPIPFDSPRHTIVALRNVLIRRAAIDQEDAYCLGVFMTACSTVLGWKGDTDTTTMLQMGVKRCLEVLVRDHSPSFRVAAQVLTALGAQEVLLSLRTCLSMQSPQEEPKAASLSSSTSSSSAQPKLKINIGAFKS